MEDKLRKEIEKTFKIWLEKIKDEKIKESVIKTYILAIKKSKFKDFDEVKKMPFTILTDSKGISFIEHTLTVTYGAYHLAMAQKEYYKNLPYKINFDHLIAGALLHDIGKLLEIEPDEKGGYKKSRFGKILRHPMSGLLLASEAQVPDEVLNIIGCHAKEGEGAPKVVETIFIHQADFATFDPLVLLDKGNLITGAKDDNS